MDKTIIYTQIHTHASVFDQHAELFLPILTEEINMHNEKNPLYPFSTILLYEGCTSTMRDIFATLIAPYNVQISNRTFLSLVENQLNMKLESNQHDIIHMKHASTTITIERVEAIPELVEYINHLTENAIYAVSFEAVDEKEAPPNDEIFHQLFNTPYNSPEIEELVSTVYNAHDTYMLFKNSPDIEQNLRVFGIDMEAWHRYRVALPTNEDVIDVLKFFIDEGYPVSYVRFFNTYYFNYNSPEENEE